MTYCLTAYSAFHYAPAAHAAIFLNGCIPLCTAFAAFLIFRQPLDKHTWISVSIMLSSIGVMSYLMYMESGVAFGLGDLLFFISAIWWGIFTVLLKAVETIGMACNVGCGDLVRYYFCAHLFAIFSETLV